MQVLAPCSLLGNDFVWLHGHVRADASVGAWLITEVESGVDALAHWQRSSIVVELHLLLASHALVHGLNSWVLIVHPGSLHIGLLLWDEVLGVNLTDEVGDLLDAHLLKWTDLSASLVALISLEFLNSASSIEHLLLSEVVSVLGAEVASILVSSLAGDHSTEATVSGLDWSVHETQLSDVVLVNHAQHWLLLLVVHLWVLDLLLVRCLQLSEAVVWDEAKGLLLWLAVDGTQRGWNST